MTSQQRRSRISNQTSKLLNSEESSVLFRLVGNKCSSLATTVAQVLIAPAPYTKWTIKCTGVLTFIKDNPKRSYYIRVYDIKTGGLIWEQEIYNQFKYYPKTPFFHTFEADNSPAGLNFANEDEASDFAAAVSAKLHERKQRRDERRRQASRVGAGTARAPRTGIDKLLFNVSNIVYSLVLSLVPVARVERNPLSDKNTTLY